MSDHTAAVESSQQARPLTLLLDGSTRGFTPSRLVIESNPDVAVKVRWVRGERIADARRNLNIPRVSEVSIAHALVHSDKVQAENLEPEVKRPKKRPEKLSRLGGNRLRQACAVLEELYGKDIYFITLTLPGSTPESMGAIAAFSTDISNLYLQRIRDLLRRDCSDSLLVPDLHYSFVWEHQDRGALHLHMVIACPEARFMALVEQNHKEFWIQTLLRYSEKSGVDLFGRANGRTWQKQPWRVRTECARVKKSVKRYMAKYVAKGKSATNGAECSPPKRWWGVSAALQQEVDARTEKKVFSFDYSADAEHAGRFALLVASDYATTVLETNHPVFEDLIGGNAYAEPEVARVAFNEVVRCLLLGPHEQTGHHWQTVDDCREERSLSQLIEMIEPDEVYRLMCA